MGDGAFMRKNKHFKKRLSELLDCYKLTYRWDLLHLANRSHIAARGYTKYEQKKATTSEEADDDNDYDSIENTEISELIDYIQSEAKKYRT